MSKQHNWKKVPPAHMQRVWLLLEEYWAEIVYIKGIHNTVAGAVSRLEYDHSINQIAESYHVKKVKWSSKHSQRQRWMTVSKNWCNLEIATIKHEDLNFAFANHGERMKYTSHYHRDSRSIM